MILDPHDAERLARICGKFGSDSANERAVAAEMANRMVRKLGVTWHGVLTPKLADQRKESEKRSRAGVTLDMVDDLLSSAVLTPWEASFLQNIRDTIDTLSKKQARKVLEIRRDTQRRAA